MARLRNGIVNLRIVVEKLQRMSLSLGRKSSNSSSYHNDEYEDIVEDSNSVPEDVKEGHFAVVAMDGEDQPKRFVVPLSCLTQPTFVRLLELAGEEYGFDHEGALQVPCRPRELEKILADEKILVGNDDSSFGVSLGSCKAMVRSY